MSKKRPIAEQAKDKLAELLELDTIEQTEVEAVAPKTQTDIAKENQFLPVVAPEKLEKAVNIAKTTRELYNAFSPREQRSGRRIPHTKDGIHHNPAFLNFPTDKWGLTKDLKSAFITITSRIAGAEDKKALVDEVLRICMGHLEQKFEKDNSARKAAQDKASE